MTERSLAAGEPLSSPDCPFCNLEPTSKTILHEGRGFVVIADFAPQAEGHALIIPRRHYPHLAALPPELDEEFTSLKRRFGDFFLQHFGELTCWENGVFGQTVPHAHQHLLSATIDPALFRDRGKGFGSPAELRQHWAESGSTYFTVECQGVARFMPPDVNESSRLLRYARETYGGQWLLRAPERRANGGPLIDALAEAWRRYQEEPA